MITVSSCVLFQSRGLKNVCVSVAIVGEDEEGGKGEEGEGGAFRRFVLFVDVLYYSHNLTTPFLTECTEK